MEKETGKDGNVWPHHIQLKQRFLQEDPLFLNEVGEISAPAAGDAGPTIWNGKNRATTLTKVHIHLEKSRVFHG